MTTKTKVGKTTRAARAGLIIAGMKKRFTNGSQKLTLKGGAIVITVDDAITGLQSLVDNRAAVVTARAAAKLTVDTENVKLPPLVALLDALMAFIRSQFDADATALADFGLEPRQARKPTKAAVKAEAVVKRATTRKAHEPAVSPAPAPVPPVTPPKA
ncbi:MAG TPA: hypothetical protein VF765_27895 [Polyangiaceae bacterium]